MDKQKLLMIALGLTTAWFAYQSYITRKAAEECIKESMEESESFLDVGKAINGDPTTIADNTFGVAGPIPVRGEFWGAGGGI